MIKIDDFLIHFLRSQESLSKENTSTSTNEHKKRLDYCHSSGKFQGLAREKYNVARPTVNFIPAEHPEL